MRLVCPNCEAKYEVPEDAIPETGRDVQCANCGHAWYQMRQRAPVAEPAAAVTAAAAAPAAAAPAAEPVAEPAPETDAVPEPAAHDAAPAPEAPAADAPAMPDPGPDEASGVGDPAPETPVEVQLADAAVAEASAELPAEDAEESAPAIEPHVEAVAPDPAPESAPGPELAATRVPEAPATGEGVADAGDDLPATETASENAPETVAASAETAAYAVDDSVLAILREEAEREAQARRAEVAPALETQPDLGIDAALPGARLAAGATAAAGLALDAADEAADRAAGRRTRLPDVEEINSTLRPSEVSVDDTLEPAALPEVEPRSSFRSGFLLVLTIAILASALYISADALARAVPSLAGVLDSYVSFINSLRLQMDGLMQSATVAINGTGG